MVDFSKLFETEEDAALKNYAARLPVYAVDPETGFTNYTNPAVPELKLPVQGMHDYVPGSGVVRPPLQWFPSVQQGMENVKAIAEEGIAPWPTIKDRLFGSKEGKVVNSLSGRVKVESDAPFVERFQTWPEKMVRSGISLPTDVMTGAVQTGVGLRRGDYSDDPYAPQPLSHLIERTQDLAGLAAGGSIAATGVKAEAPGVISRVAKTLKDRLQEVFAADNEAGTAIAALSQADKFRLSAAHRNILMKSTDDMVEYANAKKLTNEEMKAVIDDNMSSPRNRVKMFNDFVQKRNALLSDNEAGTAIGAAKNSLANRLNEHLNEPRNAGKSMPEILNRQRASEGYEAAIRDSETKKVTTGMWHEEVIDKIAKEKGIPREDVNMLVSSPVKGNLVKGYVDHNGKFWTEQQIERRSQSKSAMFRSDDIVGTGLAAAANAPRLYSAVERAVESSKTNKAAPDQWLGPRTERIYTDKNTGKEITEVKYSGMLGNTPGITVEEIEHLRLPEWIEEQKKLGKKSISKEELNKHINENKVELNEKWSGESDVKYKRNEQNPDVFDVFDKDQKQIAEIVKMSGNRYQVIIPGERTINYHTFDQAQNYINNKTKAAPRFAQYQLPGGTNYREMLLSIKDNPVKVKRIEEINNELSSINKQLKEYGQSLFGGEELKAKKYALAQERLELEQSFTHEHWPGQKDVAVHSRMNDRFIPDENGPSVNEIAGKRPGGPQIGDKGLNSLHAEEIQSDWLQKGNSEGFKLPAKEKAKLEPEFNKIDQKILKHAEDTKDESIVANPDLKDAIKTAIEKKVITKADGDLYLRYSSSENIGAVKDAPFKSNWSDLMVKRLIRQAAEEGKDSISWTPGQAQIDRYPGLQQHYDRVEYNPKTQNFKAYDKDGKLTVNKELNPSQLIGHIGKETTDKLLNNPSRNVNYEIKKNGVQYEVKDAEGKIRRFVDENDAKDWIKTQTTNILDNADLKIGGEFHKKFYDEILVNKVNAIANSMKKSFVEDMRDRFKKKQYDEAINNGIIPDKAKLLAEENTKKLGPKELAKALNEEQKYEDVLKSGRVEERKLNPYDKNEYDNVIEDMTKRLKKDFYDSAIKEGFSEEKAVKFANKHTEHLEPWQLAKALGEESKLSEAFQKKLNFDKHGNMPIWVLRITPEMKKHALEKGFSMFETGLPLPTNNDDKKYKLIPVSHNPFLSNRLM